LCNKFFVSIKGRSERHLEVWRVNFMFNFSSREKFSLFSVPDKIQYCLVQHKRQHEFTVKLKKSRHSVSSSFYKPSVKRIKNFCFPFIKNVGSLISLK